MFYTDKVYSHFESPMNVGKIDSPSAQALVGAPYLGAVIELTLDIQEDKIQKARFKAYGGGAVIASMSWLTSEIENKSLEEAKKITAQDIIKEFSLNSLQMTFALMAIETLQKAIVNYEPPIAANSRLKM